MWVSINLCLVLYIKRINLQVFFREINNLSSYEIAQKSRGSFFVVFRLTYYLCRWPEHANTNCRTKNDQKYLDRVLSCRLNNTVIQLTSDVFKVTEWDGLWAPLFIYMWFKDIFNYKTAMPIWVSINGISENLFLRFNRHVFIYCLSKVKVIEMIKLYVYNYCFNYG